VWFSGTPVPRKFWGARARREVRLAASNTGPDS